ncbi:hypothetical protein V6N11_020181 [Hibiscus sabdariffa]|uniref:Uncharacterized protein n=1 Tax=Hibiscus sabdariffa TaxID=183260 RepID=A0ABR1ZD47_9ROSI
MMWSATDRLISPLHLLAFNDSITVFGKSKPIRSRLHCFQSRAMETNADTSKATALSIDDFLCKKPYSPPSWASNSNPSLPMSSLSLICPLQFISGTCLICPIKHF